MLIHPAARVVIVGFDGLRPDLIDPTLTPNLVRLQRLGVTFANHRTVYPSETRVAFASLVTGAPASAHGLVGNRYLDRAASPARYIDTADAALLEAIDCDHGPLLTATSLGEALAAAGRSMAVIATNSPGATRLLNHRSRTLGHICLSGHFADVSMPEDFVRKVVAALGPATPESKPEPSLAAQAYITTAFLEHVWPKAKPDTTILFYGEPDTSSHFNGVRSQKTREAISCADAQLGRILDWWEAEGRAEGVQIVAVSDHGHITQHTKVSVGDCLREAGFLPSSSPTHGADAIIIPGHVGAIYLSEPTPVARDRVVEALMAQSWCGSLFTTGRNDVEGVAPGTFASSLVFADHVRAPDIQFTFRTDDSIDRYGLIGGCYFDNERAAGTGVHGGLHPNELRAVAIAAGSAFHAGGIASVVPSGVCDVAPTVLRLLGIAPPRTMTGRALEEALVETSRAIDAPPEPQILEIGQGAYRQALRRVRVGSNVYIDGGWAGSSALADAQHNQAWGG